MPPVLDIGDRRHCLFKFMIGLYLNSCQSAWNTFISSSLPNETKPKIQSPFGRVIEFYSLRSSKKSYKSDQISQIKELIYRLKDF